MKRYFLTYVGFFIFVTTLLITQHHARAEASSIATLQNYRDMFAVKQGSSVDGGVHVDISPQVNNVSNNMKVPNHVRNLRVFASHDAQKIPVLYLEQSKPHVFYTVRGPFEVPFNKNVFKWTDQATLSFSATGTDDIYQKYTINMHTLSWSAAQLGTKNITLDLSDGATDVE